MRGLITALLAALALAAPPIATASSSGILGQVLTRQVGGLGCVGIRASCFKPVAGVTVTFAQRQRTVRATSDRLGRFKVLLAPGTWTARAPGLLAPRTGRVQVRVREGRYLRVAFLVRSATALR